MKLREILKNETPFIIQCEIGVGLNIINAIKAKVERKDVIEMRLSMCELSDIKKLQLNNNTFYIFDEIDRATNDVLSFIKDMTYKDFICISHDANFEIENLLVYHYDFDTEFSDIFTPEFVDSCEKFFGGNTNPIKKVEPKVEPKVELKGWEDHWHTVDINNAEDILGYPYIIKDNIFNNGVYARKMLQQIRDGLKYIKENKLTFLTDEYITSDFTNFLYFDKEDGIIKKFTCEQGLFLREKGIEIISKALKEKLDIYLQNVMLECDEIKELDIDNSKQFFKQEVRVLRHKMQNEIKRITTDIEVRKDVISKMVEQNVSMIDNYYVQLDVEA